MAEWFFRGGLKGLQKILPSFKESQSVSSQRSFNGRIIFGVVGFFILYSTSDLLVSVSTTNRTDIVYVCINFTLYQSHTILDGPSWLSPTGESFRSVNQGLSIQQTNTASLLSSGSSASLASAHSSAETPSIAGHWPDLPTSYPTVRVPTYVQAGLAQNAFARPQLPVAWPNVGYDAPVTPTGAESSFPGPYNLSFAPPPQLFLGQFIDPQFNTATPINPSVTPDQPQHDMYPAHDLPSSHFPAPPMSYYSLPEISKPPVDGIKYCIPSDEQWSRWIIGTEIRYLTGYWRDSPGLLQWRQSTVEIKNARRALHLSMDSLPDGKSFNLIWLYSCLKLNTGCRWMERPTVDADLAKICNKVNKINASNSRYIKENIATIFPSIAPTDSTIKKGTHQWNITVQQGAAALNIDEGFLHTTVGGVVLLSTEV